MFSPFRAFSTSSTGVPILLLNQPIAGEVYKLKTSKIPKGHPLSPDPFQHSDKEERETDYLRQVNIRDNGAS